jgi:hypothetical protein
VPPFAGRGRARARRPTLSPWWVALPAASVTLAAAAALVLWTARTGTSAEPAARTASGTVAAAPVQAASTSISTSTSAFDPAPLDFLLEQPVLASAPDFDSDPVKVGAP